MALLYLSCMRNLWCVLALFLILGTSCKKEEKPSSEKGGKKEGRALSLSAMIAQNVEVPRSVRGLATVLPGESVEIKSEISGRVQSVLFREGGYVERGALLVKLSDAELQATRSKALSKVDLAQAIHARKAQQLELQAISKQELEQSAAELASAKADLAILDAQIAKTEIRAPFSGRVGFQHVSTGAVVSSGFLLTTLVQLQPVKLEFSIPGDLADLAQVGTELEFEVQGVKQRAVIYAQEGALDPGTRSLQVRAKVKGKSANLIPGATVPFRLVGKPLQGLMVPPDALAGNAKGIVLYVYQGGKAIPKSIEIGMRTADQVQVLKGIQSGDTVLCVGAAAVRPGAKVEILGFR